MKKELVKIIYFLFIFSTVNGQILKEQVNIFFTENNETQLKAYLSPLSKAFGASLGSSYYHNAKTYKFPHFDLGINYLSVPISKSNKFFSTSSGASPTVFGPSSNDTTTAKGLNKSSFNIPVLQLNIGVGDNTNLILRYSEWNDDKLGEIEIFGAGVKYELENLFSISPIPFSIGVVAIYQKYKVDDYIEGAVFELNLIGSKKINILPIEIYGGAGYINNVTNVNNPSSDEKFSVSVPGLEEIRYQLGLSFSISILNLNAEYDIGNYKSISAGIRIVL